MPAIFMPSAAKWDARISFIFAVSYSSAADTATFLLYSIFVKKSPTHLHPPALDLFYRSKTCVQLHDKRTGLYLMSNGYIADDFI